MLNRLGFIKSLKAGISIRNKIKLSLLGVCIVILVGFLSINIFYTSSKIEKLIVDNYEEIALKQFEHVEYVMEHNIEVVESVAKNNLVINYVKNNGPKCVRKVVTL